MSEHPRDEFDDVPEDGARQGAHRGHNPRAREALRSCLPGPLRDATFSQLLKNDHITKRCLATLLLNLSDRPEQ